MGQLKDRLNFVSTKNQSLTQMRRYYTVAVLLDIFLKGQKKGAGRPTLKEKFVGLAHSLLKFNDRIDRYLLRYIGR